MDIPPLGPSFSAKNTGLSNEAFSVQQIVPVAQLKLVPNQSYPAQVYASTANFLTEQGLTQLANTTPSNHWLLALKGNLLNISSDQTLTVGQKITLWTDGRQVNATPAQPALPSRSLLTSNPASTVSAQRSMLTTVLNSLLNQQVKLETGFDILRQLGQAASASTPAAQNTQAGVQGSVANTVLAQIQQILNALPNRTNGAPLPQGDAITGAPNTPGSSMAYAIDNTTTSATPQPSWNTSHPLSVAQLKHWLAFVSSSARHDGATASGSQPLPHHTASANLTQTPSGHPTHTAPPRSFGQGEVISSPASGLTPGPSQSAAPSAGASGKVLSGPHNSAQLASLPDQSASVATRRANLTSTSGSIDGGAVSSGPAPRVSNTPNNVISSAMTPNPNTVFANRSDTPASEAKDLKQLLTQLVHTLQANANDKAHSPALGDPDLLNMPFNFPPPLAEGKLASTLMSADIEWTTGQLLKLAAGMLNRMLFHQVNSLYQAQTQSAETGTTQQSWFYEVPLMSPQQQIETLHLRVDRQAQQASQEEKERTEQVQWKVALSFDFEGLGHIYIQANLMPPSVSSIIWASDTETLATIQKEQPFFRKRLKELGLEVGDIICQYGQPHRNKAKLDRSLVDIKA